MMLVLANQMQKPLYLIDIAKLDRYREKALGRYEGVPNIFHFNETKYFSPLYIVQKCAPLRGWKKFINVEKIENFTVQKNIICSATGNLNPIFYIYWGNEGIKYCVMHNFCHFE